MWGWCSFSSYASVWRAPWLSGPHFLSTSSFCPGILTCLCLVWSGDLSLPSLHLLALPTRLLVLGSLFIQICHYHFSLDIIHSITFILNLVFWTVLSLFLLSSNSFNKWNLKPSTSETGFKASCLLYIVFYLSIQVPYWLSHLHQFKDLFVFILCITSYLHPPI